ncbi:50S ribosomal protein L23 [Candidatus Woesearchaeota archaeon]|nr:50S ribosomal protein L23 [Candidatus Woesearchaeota archaeon]
MNYYKIIKYPLSTEKSLRLMEAENKLIFIVDNKATKTEIKEAIESIYNVKVIKVTTMIGPDSKKKAFIKFDNKNPAIDLATNLGMM